MGLLARLRRKRQSDQDIEQEIRAHLAMAAQDRMEAGESAEAAMQNARRDLLFNVLIPLALTAQS